MPQMIDVVGQEDIVLTGGLQVMAENASDDEIRALTIANYQMLREILAFVRDLAATLEKVSSNGGPMGAMMRSMKA